MIWGLDWGLIAGGSFLLLLALFGRYDPHSRPSVARIYGFLWSGLLLFALGCLAFCLGGN